MFCLAKAFLSTLSLRRATGIVSDRYKVVQFLSTLSLRRATGKDNKAVNEEAHFYPRSPCGERHYDDLCFDLTDDISIHALLAESDIQQASATPITAHFYPRSPCGERPGGQRIQHVDGADFYPRSPCGERPLLSFFHLPAYPFLSTLSLRRATALPYALKTEFEISIHALLAESDQMFRFHFTSSDKFLSTLSLRRATTALRQGLQGDDISIHALLAESDRVPVRCWRLDRYFYPRSPCGERRFALRVCVAFAQFLSTLSLRRATSSRRASCSSVEFLSTLSLRRATRCLYTARAAAWHFYPRSPCGERPDRQEYVVKAVEFLSTLSLRRATPGSRRRLGRAGHFYPRSPCGERRAAAAVSSTITSFLSTLSLRRATSLSVTLSSPFAFLSTLSLRRATHDPAQGVVRIHISIHALLAESDGGSLCA